MKSQASTRISHIFPFCIACLPNVILRPTNYFYLVPGTTTWYLVTTDHQSGT